MNAVVKIDGELYIVEAGYDEEALRHYNIRRKSMIMSLTAII